MVRLRAPSREAVQTALAPQTPSEDADWSRVEQLKPAARIFVILRGTDRKKRYFVRADDVALLVSRTAEGATGLGVGSPEQIARADVAQITLETVTRRKAPAVARAVLGLVGGVAFGLWRGYHVECPEPSFGDCLATDLLLIPAGFSIGGAVAGYFMSTETTTNVIYR
jgi:hypothetical protein